MVHRNAPLSETGRLRLARCVVEEGWPLRRAAERFQVSATTAARWASRYRDAGWAGMVDRIAAPSQPQPHASRTERRIIKVRVLRRWGPARIGYLLGYSSLNRASRVDPLRSGQTALVGSRDRPRHPPDEPAQLW